ncbi:DUF1641 domain-containing protein [Xanthomonas campestris]|uniref:DUF1641 domain-containing protein n=1 Tax=Xanthomonas campestris TaxID=339 RepID=UPI0023583B36|nr:DUF1641 domain-containing protein [Xanthomonas campestris]MDC8745118.1 DUF1641 domain-containing protein [Xanthomonas campestris]
MAEPLDYDVKPTPIGPTAREELDRLLETLHQRGILRLANDLVGARDELAKVLVDGINQPGPLNALQNVSILAMAVSRIPPSQFYKVVFAGKDALDQIARSRAQTAAQGEAPGLRGAYRLLQDEAVWNAITPVLDGLKAFAAGLDKQVDKPISAFSGKPSES